MRNLVKGFLIVAALLALVAGAYIVRDEARIRSVRPGLPEEQVIQTLGAPHSVKSKAGLEKWASASPTCKAIAARALVYTRNFRRGLVVYLDETGEVVCTDRR